jgi:KipI family sensor histidine kinase inhibitor
LLPVGDCGLVVEFGSEIAPEANARVVGLDRELCALAPRGLVETVPTYRSLMVVYDPLSAELGEVRQAVETALARSEEGPLATGRAWVVPTSYGGALGEDLADIAAYAGMTEAEVVRLHAGAEYRVYMIGFAPGFAYLGGLPEQLHRPRRAVPKPRVEAGSVMLGGQQAAVASVATPTGWYVLGRTPVRAFDMARDDGAFLFRPGDAVRFEPVDAHTYAALDARAASGEPVARLEVQP